MKIHIDAAKKDTKLPAILSAALRLFVDQGIEGTSIKDISSAAKVAEGALYRHFKSKEDLAWYLFVTNLKDYTSHLLGEVLGVRETRERIALFVRESFSACDKNRTLFQYLILAEHSELKRYSADYVSPGKVVEQLVAEGQARGDLRKGQPWVLFSMIAGPVHRLCVLRSRGLLKGPLSVLSAETAETIWEAVKA